MRKVLSKNCWDKPSEISELPRLFSVVIDLMREKDESDAVIKIIGYAEMSSLELAHQMFDESKSSLIEFDHKYRSLVSQVLSNLDPEVDLEKLVSKGLAFYDLIAGILEKGKLEILWKKRINQYPVSNVRISLSLNGDERRFTLKNISNDGLKVLQNLVGK